jgi:hypothetical protein
VVRMRGLEPPQPCGYQNLNLARLPIPPHPHICHDLATVGLYSRCKSLELLSTMLEPESKEQGPLEAETAQNAAIHSADSREKSPDSEKTATKVARAKRPRRTWQTIQEWALEQRKYPAEKVSPNWVVADLSLVPVERDYFGDVFSPTIPQTWVVADCIEGLMAVTRSKTLKCCSVRVPHSCLKHPMVHEDIRYARNSSRDSLEHRDLKILGVAWLRSIGAKRAATEMECGFGRADAYSPDLDIAVECGNTRPERITWLFSGAPRAILVLPYEANEADHYRGALFWIPQQSEILGLSKALTELETEETE